MIKFHTLSEIKQYIVTGISIHGANIPLDTLQSFRGRFYESDDPTNSVIALKDNVMCGTDSSVRTGVVASSRLDAAQSEIKVL